MDPAVTKRMLLKGYDDFYVRHDLDACYAFCAADVLFERPPFPPVRGVEANREDDEDMFATFSEMVVDVHGVVVEGLHAAVHWTWTGVHSGPAPVMGVPPSGKRVRMSGITWYEFDEDGLIIRQTECSDMLGLFQQLGLVPVIA